MFNQYLCHHGHHETNDVGYGSPRVNKAQAQKEWRKEGKEIRQVSKKARPLLSESL